MICVDSSVFIDYFNGQANRETDLLDNSLGTDLIIIGDIVALEVLQGFKNERDFKTVKNLFSELEQRQMITFELAIKYAEMYRKLRADGITIRKSIDTIIAGFCILNNYPLLQKDRDFKPFQENLGLILI